jgi:glycosyltransferase involved in cell wall biosynthesis
MPEISLSYPELSIIMPCLNEEQTIGECLKEAKHFCEKAKIKYELLVGDNGSTDNSIEVAKREGARIIEIERKGYGAALIGALSSAHGKYLIMGDSDGSYDFSNLSGFLEKFRDGYDLVMGNRFLGKIESGAMPWKNRWIGNPILSFFGRLLFKSGIGDFHSGLRGISRAAFERLELKSSGMEFASEMVVKATLSKLKITEVPITLRPDRRGRPPHLRPWRDGWRHLKLMLLYSPRWLFLLPGIFLSVTGLILSLLLWNGPLLINGIGFDINTMLFSSMGLFVGIQCITFAVFSKFYGIQQGILPKDGRLRWLSSFRLLEIGLVIGIVLILAGLIGGAIGIGEWSNDNFGALMPREILRVTIPSVLSIGIGFHLVFSSFFLALLQRQDL